MPKFLVLRFSSIGDIVLTTPVVRCLKQQVKDAEVHYCTRDIFSEIIRYNPYLDKQFFLGEDLKSLIRQLKQEKYDYVIDLHHNLRTFLVKKKLGAKSFSFNKLNFEKWLMVNFKINRLPRRHLVDRYLDTVKSLGVMNDGLGLDFFLPAEAETVIQKLPTSHQNGYIGFVIGAKHYTKQLPVEKIISVCKKINQPVVLLGGKEDYEKGEAIMKHVQSQIPNLPSLIFNACGKFSILESAALVKQASKIITHDTGLMHIAAAFKKEIISIWGNTIPEFGMTPYLGSGKKGKVTIVEVKNLSCRPCTKIGFDKCPKIHFKCMKEIDEEQILASIKL